MSVSREEMLIHLNEYISIDHRIFVGSAGMMPACPTCNAIRALIDPANAKGDKKCRISHTQTEKGGKEE